MAVEKVQKYIDSVLSGKRRAGLMEQLCVKRHIDDLVSAKKSDYPYAFDQEKATLACSFFSILKHFKGEWAGKKFELEPWQAFVVWCIFGWVKKSDSARRFTYADIEVARKNGKTTLAAGIALYMMVMDGESGAEIYSAAVDREQARICWETAWHIAKNSPALSRYLRFFRHAVVMESTASTFKPLSRDSKNKDGLNPHCAVCDERHAWQTNEMYDVIKSGLGARKQPLVLSITTAGFDMDAPYFKDLKVMREILKGEKQQDNHFILIFEPDKGDEWSDPDCWEKANPNFGVSVSEEYFRNELSDALNKGGATEVNFKTKNLNMWVDAPDVWVPDEVIARCNKPVIEEDLIGSPCYAGLDLASHKDLNALALFFPDSPTRPFRFLFFVPEAKIANNEDRADYRVWEQEGRLIVTPGDTIDIGIMVAAILEELKKYDLKNLSFDPYKAYHGVIQGLINGGVENFLDHYTQSIGNMSEPAKEIERMLLTEEINIGDNPIIRWNFRNVTMYKDANGNIRPDKRRSSGKIDGVVAMINAVGGWLSLCAQEGKKQVYKERTLRVVSLNK